MSSGKNWSDFFQKNLDGCFQVLGFEVHIVNSVVHLGDTGKAVIVPPGAATHSGEIREIDFLHSKKIS